MNVAIVLSGGCGKRFGDDIPKQYHELKGQPVINYVVEAALKSQKTDRIILVIDEEYIKYVHEAKNSKIDCVPNGKERVYSVKNGLDFINDNYNCSNVIILDAVSPMITSKIIDDYFELIEKYDVVTTAKKCVGEIFNLTKFEKINRNNYYFCHSPEAYKFKELYKNIDLNSEYTELIYHYDKEPNIYFYTEFTNLVKITYKSDILYCEALMNCQDENERK